MMIRDDLLRLVPQVLRARGWRLYTENGRFVDLWQYGGRAILGHNPPNMLRAFKNNGERGLFAPHPHFAGERLYKALSALLPGFSFRLYTQEAAALLLQKIPPDKTAVWRPFLNDPAVRAAPVLLPVLPCAFPGVPAVFAVNTTALTANPAALVTSPAESAEKTALPEFPPSQLISPVALAAAVRSVYDLIARPERGTPCFPKIDRAVKKSAVWKRQGIYLTFADGENAAGKNPGNGDVPESYTALFRHFLENGFLLPPSPEDPLILPGELSPGEEAKLAAVLSASQAE
jgi:hypothetical protein